MKLDVPERLILLGILPQQGSFITLKLVRKLRESLSFSEKEIADYGFKYHWRCPECEKTELSPTEVLCPKCQTPMQPAGQVTWDERKAAGQVKDVHMGSNMFELCSSTLRKMSDEGRLGEIHMTLYEKFVESEVDTKESEE